MKRVVSSKEFNFYEDKGWVKDFRIGKYLYSIILKEGEPQLIRYDDAYDDDIYIVSIKDGYRDAYTPTEFDIDAVEVFLEWLDDGSLNQDDNFYYWLDTDYHYGDFSVPKFALTRGELDEEGNKIRDTEEIILWSSYEDLGIDDISDYDTSLIDKYIYNELGFLPDYEIN